MKHIVICALVALFGLTLKTVHAEDGLEKILGFPFSDFYVHHLVLHEDVFKKPSTQPDQLLVLARVDRRKADLICDMWRAKAMVANVDYIAWETQRGASRAAKLSGEDREKVLDETRGLIDDAMIGFYSSHWTEISDMIEKAINISVKKPD